MPTSKEKRSHSDIILGALKQLRWRRPKQHKLLKHSIKGKKRKFNYINFYCE